MSKLTDRQRDALHIVEQHGPLTPRDLDRQGFSASVDAARLQLTRLEKRRFVEATYTESDGGGRAYRITEKGAEALAAAHGEREPEQPAKPRKLRVGDTVEQHAADPTRGAMPNRVGDHAKVVGMGKSRVHVRFGDYDYDAGIRHHHAIGFECLRLAESGA